MGRLAALVFFTLPLLAQLPPGVMRFPFRDMKDASFFAATADDTFWAATVTSDDVQRFGSAGAEILDLPPTWRNTLDMITGPDGALWLSGQGWVARIDPSTNAVQRWPLGGLGCAYLLSGPDGNVWLIQSFEVVRMRPDGTVLSRYPTDTTSGFGAFGSDGALYIAAGDRLVRITAAGERSVYPASANGALRSGAGFLWLLIWPDQIARLSYRGETLATYRIAMTPFASDTLGNLWLRATTSEGEIVGQLSPFGVLTRFGPLPALPSTQCFPRWYGGMAFLSDGRVAMSDQYPDLPRLAIAPNPCWGAVKPVEYRNTVTILDPRIAPVFSVESLGAVRRRSSRH